MPRTKLASHAEDQRLLARLIEIAMDDHNTNARKTADKMGFGFVTLYRRLKNPGSFTLDELVAARKILNIPLDEMIEAIRVRF